MKQQIIDFFKNDVTGQTDYKKVGIASFVLVLIVAFAVKAWRDNAAIPTTDNADKGKNNPNNPNNSNNNTPNNGQNNGNGTTIPNPAYDPQKFAKEMYDFTQLAGGTFLCRQPNDFCYHLTALADQSDDFIIQLGKVYKNRYGKKLSDSIEANGCSCSNDFVAARTKYPMDKGNLLKRIKALEV